MGFQIGFILVRGLMTLFLAEKTIAGDDPRLGQAVREGAGHLRELARSQDPETETARRSLEALVAEVFTQQQSGPRMDTATEDLPTLMGGPGGGAASAITCAIASGS